MKGTHDFLIGVRVWKNSLIHRMWGIKSPELRTPGDARRWRVRILRVTVSVLVVAMAVFMAITWSLLYWLGAAVTDLQGSVDSLQKARSRDEALAVSPLLLHYQLDVPGRGEVFPAMAAGPAPEYWPVAILRITNTATRPAALIVSVEIPGWSRPSEQSLVVAPREERQLRFQPELLPRAFQSHEIRQASLDVRVAGLDGVPLFTESRRVLIHGGSEIYWGRQFANAQVAARWVTPHDAVILELVSAAREHMPKGRMAGYSNSTGDASAVARHVRAQARAVYRVLQKSGLSYVSSLFVMGDYVGQAQRVRLPRETLDLKSANCMDVSAVFASAMENLGMQPLLVIVPGHAFAGLRLAKNSQKVLYLDLTVLPKGSFESAIRRAEGYMTKTAKEKILTVDVAAARVLGIYPLVPEEPAGALSQLTPGPGGGGNETTSP